MSVAIGDHGLVRPDAIPGDDLDLAAVSAGAETIGSGGKALKDAADDIPTQWSLLSQHYEAPESGHVLTVMQPVATDAHHVGTAARAVASALDDYATAAAAPKKALDALRTEAAAFVERVKDGVTAPPPSPYERRGDVPVSGSWNGYADVKAQQPDVDRIIPWYEDPVTKSENEHLIARINHEVALLQAAQEECALAIKKASGVSVKNAFHAPSEMDLNARGVDLPWSAVGTAEGKTCSEQFQEGAENELIDSLVGFAGLFGYDGGGHFSWDNVGTSWKGMADGAATLGLMLSPYAWMDRSADPDGESAKRMDPLIRGFESMWEDAQKHPGAAGGAAAMSIGIGAFGPEAMGFKVGRTAELLDRLAALGARGSGRDVVDWARAGVSEDRLDAFMRAFEAAHAERAATPAGQSLLGRGKSLEGEAFDRLLAEKLYRQRLAEGLDSTVPLKPLAQDFLDRGGLAADEGRQFGPSTSHTLGQHTADGLTPEEFDRKLRGRTHADGQPKTNSLFTESTAALDNQVAAVIDGHQRTIEAWLKRTAASADPPSQKPIELELGPPPIGVVFDPATNTVHQAVTLRVVLIRDESPSGWSVLTAYPEG